MKIRLIDYDEYALVLTITRRGRAEIGHPGVCAFTAGELLRTLAEKIEADHGPDACDPAAEVPDEALNSQPLDARNGSLDDESKVWTDGRGHRWDLSITWVDVVGVLWRWTGRLDRLGAPLMRSAWNDGEDDQPLDVLRAVVGPISPVAGDGS